jgi:hypothetical protein
MRFLVQYKCRQGVLVSMESFSEADHMLAVSRLSDLEEVNTDPDLEIVLFGAASRESFRRGYPEYFECELADSEAPTV